MLPQKVAVLGAAQEIFMRAASQYVAASQGVTVDDERIQEKIVPELESMLQISLIAGDMFAQTARKIMSRGDEPPSPVDLIN